MGGDGKRVLLVKKDGMKQAFGSGSGFQISLDPDPVFKKSLDPDQVLEFLWIRIRF